MWRWNLCSSDINCRASHTCDAPRVVVVVVVVVVVWCCFCASCNHLTTQFFSYSFSSQKVVVLRFFETFGARNTPATDVLGASEAQNHSISDVFLPMIAKSMLFTVFFSKNSSISSIVFFACQSDKSTVNYSALAFGMHQDQTFTNNKYPK